MSEMFDCDAPVKKQMVLFFIIDTSSSMSGSKIGAVNTAIREVLPELKDIGGSDFNLKIACLTFATSCAWMDLAPVEVENFRWRDISAHGWTSMGLAFKELNGKLSRKEFMNAPSGSVAPVLFLMSDGAPTDPEGVFEEKLAELKKNTWFKHAIKVAVAIGDDADQECLAEFTGTKETVITVHTPEALKEYIKAISITTTEIGTQSSNESETSKQDKVVNAMKNMPNLYANITDVNNISTSSTEWD